jgi:hypothetical protein
MRVSTPASGLRAAGLAALEAEEAEASAEEAEADAHVLVIDELGAPPVVLEDLMDAFVAQHAGRHRQRTEGWLAKKAGSIGGSEIAALMGHNPYSSFDDVVGAKVGIRAFTGNVACWWGTMFESAIERFVEIDTGTRLAGTDVSVPAPRGSGLEGRHANSPDGYGVVVLWLTPGDEWALRTTDAPTLAAAAGRPTMRIIVDWEFKCPYRRQPKGDIPKHYRPQLWSGLALSPIAHKGLFVDAAFRKCALWNFGPAPGYDRTYHRERKVERWTAPIAWGFTAIYAPRLDAPAGDHAPADDGGDDGSDDGLGDIGSADTERPVSAPYEAWQLHGKYFGLPLESPQEAARAGREYSPDPIDFGDCEKSIFETMMLHLDRKRFSAEHHGPCMQDGRGARLRTSAEISTAIDGLAAAAPAHHFLLGVLPWKMFEVDYSFIERRVGFLEEVAPLIHSCLDLAAQFRAAPNPEQAYYAHLEGKRQKRWEKAGTKKARGAPDVTTGQVQDLFDSL